LKVSTIQFTINTLQTQKSVLNKISAAIENLDTPKKIEPSILTIEQPIANLLTRDIVKDPSKVIMMFAQS